MSSLLARVLGKAEDVTDVEPRMSSEFSKVAAPQQQSTAAPAASQSVSQSSSKGNSSMSTAPIGTKVVTGVVRGSFLNLFTARAQEEGQEAKFSMVCLIPKTDTTTLAKIKAAQEAAATKKWPNKRPPVIAYTLHDGDGVRPSTGEPFGDECKGHMVISCSSKLKPKVIDRNNNEVLDPTEITSGDYFKVSLNFFGYEAKGKKGVSAGLNNVLFWEKGEALGGRSRAEDDFASDINGGEAS